MQFKPLLCCTLVAVILSGMLLPEASLAQADESRDQIGHVFGEPVYRDQIRQGEGDRLEAELHRLFAREPMRRYREKHRDQYVPTEDEIETARQGLERKIKKQTARDVETLRERLAKIDEQLASDDLNEAKRQSLQEERAATVDTFGQLEEREIAITRQTAEFILGGWKFQKHLYDKYGGGRILFQQAGLEAFDAYRAWLEDLEKQGQFAITDPQLRKTFYHYWTDHEHGAFLTSDPERIHETFLEPDWLK